MLEKLNRLTRVSRCYFGGGGGGGSPPKAPKLQQIDTSVGGKLWNTAADMGQQWANYMRGSYGLGQSTAPPSWEAQYLGPGALAMMGQAQQEIGAPGQDPQTQQALTTAFGGPSAFTGGAWNMPQAGAQGGQWNLGADPYQVAQNLGKQFRAPLSELQRGQGFESELLSQWRPPQLTLTGEDLLSVSLQQAAQNAQAQQAAFEASLTGATTLAGQQAAAQAAGIGALGKGIGAGISAAGSFFNSPSLNPNNYYTPSFFGGLFSGWGSGMTSSGDYIG